MIKILFFTMAALVFPLSATAQTDSSMGNEASSTNSEPASSKLSMQDTHFIKMAAIAGLAEVSDGKLAENMGGPSVKGIGAQMVRDHSKANAQLTTIAEEDGVTPLTMSTQPMPR
jgi:putative membrane protein